MLKALSIGLNEPLKISPLLSNILLLCLFLIIKFFACALSPQFFRVNLKNLNINIIDLINKFLLVFPLLLIFCAQMTEHYY